jgi:hypothetical protein
MKKVFMANPAILTTLISRRKLQQGVVIPALPHI